MVVKHGKRREVPSQIIDLEGDAGEPTRLSLIKKPDGSVVVIVSDVGRGASLAVTFRTASRGGTHFLVVEKLRELMDVIARPWLWCGPLRSRGLQPHP